MLWKGEPMRAIDGDALKEEIDYYIRESGWGETYNENEALRWCLEFIDNQPTIEPEIVRCKECANYDTDWTSEMVPDRHYCLVMDGMMPKDGFCHKAERRTDEGD